MNVLGLSCYFHDSAACLVRDGKVVAAAQEERFSRRKNTADFPIQAVNYCLQSGNLTINDIDYIGFYEKPYLKYGRLILSFLRTYPFSLKSFLRTLPLWLKDRLIIPLVFDREFGYKGKFLFLRHHLSHAASAFLVSPFEESAILTVDGVGEWATTTLGKGEGNKIKILKEIYFPDSLGLLYTAVTTYLGFTANAGEGKTLGLAGYGKPVYLNKLKEVIRLNPDGSFKMDSSYFNFNKGSRMYSHKFLKTFGPDRKPEDELETRHKDMAASLQAFIEEALVAVARHLYQETGCKNLCMAGGVTLNCVANHKILEETPFKRIYVQPAAGDAGGSLGAAVYIYNTLLNNPRTYVMKDTYLGPSFSSAQIRRILQNRNLKFRELNDSELLAEVASKIARDRIFGWFQGRMEFGPRALGNRSILANALNPDMLGLVNDRIKHREPFRPYAPLVPEEKASEYFELLDKSPFMLLAPRVLENKAAVIPAVTHVDGTARVQTVSSATNPRLWQLLREFEKLTGVPILLNTSFNLRGEPIVCNPEDAINTFQKSDMDGLVLENFIVEKEA
ncbi:MAG: carbamoyltransferase [bacterium]